MNSGIQNEPNTKGLEDYDEESEIIVQVELYISTLF
jgi:hypothetical protein